MAKNAKTPRPQSWNIKVPTTGGPVAYLNIFDRQEQVRIPLEMPMGEQGTYRYERGHYRWCPEGPS